MTNSEMQNSLTKKLGLRPNKDLQKFLEQTVLKVSECDEATWKTLSSDEQKWYDKAKKPYEEEREIPDFPDREKAATANGAAGSPRTKQASKPAPSKGAKPAAKPAGKKDAKPAAKPAAKSASKPAAKPPAKSSKPSKPAAKAASKSAKPAKPAAKKANNGGDSERGQGRTVVKDLLCNNRKLFWGAEELTKLGKLAKDKLGHKLSDITLNATRSEFKNSIDILDKHGFLKSNPVPPRPSRNAD